ncbi:MAG: hypothetical protein M1836_006473 [Candelina mexicana]|nr:MAG: hypothetical protein M1836_006473 [Candelina mexicana]
MGCEISSLTKNLVRRPRHRKGLSTDIEDGKITDDTSNGNNTVSSTHSQDISSMSRQTPQDQVSDDLLDWGYGYGDTLIEAMEHVGEATYVAPVGQIEYSPPPSPPPPPPPPPTVAPMLCVICTKSLTSKEGAPSDCYSCPGCNSPYCMPCLKSMFLSACKDQSRMPPKCCRVIHLSVVFPHLSNQETALYRMKYEEWSTPNPLYCPVPSCSAFIPPRLLPEVPKKVPIQAENSPIDASDGLDGLPRLVEHPEIIVAGGIASDAQVLLDLALPKHSDGTIVDPEPATVNTTETRSYPCESTLPCTDIEEQSTKPPVTPAPDPLHLPRLPSISCPQCDVQICLCCKQLQHPGTLCPPELDPSIAKLLKKWKIKRCPRCHAGVKRMFGCAHMRCHCGAQWCWNCLEPIQICNQDCGGQDESEEPALEDGDAQMEDLDEAIVMDDQNARENYDFGDEPNQDDLVPWNCNHYWMRSIEQQREQLECQQCWKLIFSEEDEKRLGVAITKEMGAWVCECGTTVCGACAGKITEL